MTVILHGGYVAVVPFPEISLYGVPAGTPITGGAPPGFAFIIKIPHAFEPAFCIKLLIQLGSTLKTISHFPSVPKCKSSSE